ncbi:hypothetical protein N0V93_001736 [Gnomoniopsis smithogilvyi]|uniref:NACHT domain-containing protein n=1 Tax=Gnomoniopsis smithogilvyi TaxID=1191159 RepID=A0A9W9D2Z8_9PEZI|nr:hypothetical protein N0V93_001736 [Gnomoniopsis smithogilvyi]
MAEIAGLSLAANIFQMVEYGAQFAVTAYRIYQSGNDAMENFRSLQILSKSLEEVTQRLETASPHASASGEALASLSYECTKTVKEMLERLDTFRLPENSKSKKREALRVAFKAQWDEEKIQALERRLDSFRNQWTLQMLEVLRSDVTASSENQNKLFQQMMQEIQTYKPNQSDIARIELMLKELITTCNTAAGSTPSVSNVPPDKRTYLEKKFLRQLKYNGMDLRQETVEEAHKKTFHWIFDKPYEQIGQWDNFQEWLSSPQQQLYWITGKPGAGKSTLMKLICDAVTKADTYEPHFDLQSEDQDLTVATFFFWAAGGNGMQKSREGLFRTLIYQLLEQHPRLISSTAPNRWEALCLFGDDSTSFTEPELQRILQNCLMELKQKRILLLIDGLDEFSGRHDDLIHFFFKLLETCSMKLCVSSRPWEIFEESFNNKSHLRIHELTHHDMEAFLLSNMRTSPQFITLEKEEPLVTQRLINEVLQKAQGVFLWVKLVTRSLIEALRDGETTKKLWKLLDCLPDGSLDDLFHRILQDLEPRYLGRAAHYIGLLGVTPVPIFSQPFAIIFSFADEDDVDYSIKLPKGLLSSVAIRGQIARLRKRINSSCKGLVEVVEVKEGININRENSTIGVWNHIVQYSHRSVKDYLESSRARAVLSGMPLRGPNPHLRLCSANLACFKTWIALEKDGLWQNDPIFILASCLWHAAQVPAEDSGVMILMVEELRRTLLPLNPPWRHLHVSREVDPDLVHPDLVRDAMFRWNTAENDQPLPFMFLSITVVYSVIEYVKANISQASGFAQQDRSSISGNLVARTFRHQATVPSEMDHLLQIATAVMKPSLDMIHLLLRNGSNLHSIIWDKEYRSRSSKRNYTIWEGALARLIACFSRDYLELYQNDLWCQTVSLMVTYGAKLNKKSVKNALKWLKLYLDKECNLKWSGGTMEKVLLTDLRHLLCGRTTIEALRLRWYVRNA